MFTDLPSCLRETATHVVVISQHLLLAEDGEAPEPGTLWELGRAAADSPIGVLSARAGLDAVAEFILMACAAAELHPIVARALSAHLGSSSQSAIRGDVLCALAERVGHSASAAAAALLPDGALLRWGLLSCSAASANHAEGQSNLFRRFVAAPRVVQFLRGEAVPPLPQPRLRRVPPLDLAALVPPLLRDQQHQDAVALIERWLFEHTPTAITTNLWLAGPPGIGRRTLLASVLARHGRALLSLDVDEVRGADPARLASILRREALLAGAVICVSEGTGPAIPSGGDGGDGAPDAASRSGDQLWRLYRAFANGGVPAVFVSALPPDARDVEVPPRVIRLALQPPEQRLELWRRLFPAVADLEVVAARFPLTPSRIALAARGARDLAAGDDRPVAPHDIATSISLSVSRRIAQLGNRIEATQTWDDVVLPPDTLESIREITDRVRHRYTVLERWGFRGHLGKGTGLAAMFGGPPGTGKTLVASLIARDLDQELYQIDLARMVSKWIGETEKNLAGVFDAADGANVVLLFDEADALFARRSEVKSSNDRYANAEVNYLLQRIERFEGLCILTTNLETQIDPAFKRRLAFRITFELPGEDERLLLWRRMVPARTPLAPDVDFAALARAYELTGGNIKNVMLRAAFMAAARHQPLGMADIQRAVRLEYRDAGKLSPAGRLHND